MKKNEKWASGDESYSKVIEVRASIEKVYDALTTLKGLAGWWTPRVKGRGTTGGDLRFEFQGLPEHVIMHVDEAQHPNLVRWTCQKHTKLREWDGTELTFELSVRGAGKSELKFHHQGLTPRLECYDHCEVGWDHFLGSIAQYAETGKGEPYGEGWDVEQCEGQG